MIKVVLAVATPNPLPINKTPRVCPVIGTGDPGNGIEICANAARNATPEITVSGKTMLRLKFPALLFVIELPINLFRSE